MTVIVTWKINQSLMTDAYVPKEQIVIKWPMKG